MKKLIADFGWLGSFPNNTPENLPARIAFFTYYMHCSTNSNEKLAKASNEKELLEVLQNYEKRMDLEPAGFQMQKGDLQRLAANTWNDPEFQEFKQNLA